MVRLSSDFIRAKEYLESIVVSTSDAICTTDTRGRVIYFSPGAEKMLSAKNSDVLGSPAHAFYAEGRKEAEALMKLLTRQGAVENRETTLKTKDGRRIAVSMSASLLKDRFGRVIGTLGISKDISERLALEKRLRELSITDNLTGLYNQRHFRMELGKAVRVARRQRQKLSLILIDLDGFKLANDQRGHLEGDRILRVFAQAVLSAIRREVDSTYRYGGDEFVILLPGLAALKARIVAGRILSAAQRRSALNGIGVSFGIATLSPGQAPSQLLRLADQRMYAMKAAKRMARNASPHARRSGRPPGRRKK